MGLLTGTYRGVGARHEIFDLATLGTGGLVTVEGGDGNDFILGSTGRDNVIFGNSGLDIIILDSVGGGNETIFGDNEAAGPGGDDLISGGSGVDKIFAGGGNDKVNGGTEADGVDGGEGNDVIWGAHGADTLLGGNGDDTIMGSGIQFGMLRQLADFNFNGLNDTAQAGRVEQILVGGSDDSANDYIDGGEGNDTLLGQGGNDILLGGAGNDAIAGGNDNDMISGNAGADVLFGEAGADLIAGGAGGDVIRGGPGGDLVAFNLGDNGDLIQNFNEGGQRDGFDLRGYFNATGFTGADPRAAGIMQVLQSGADADVYLYGAFALRIEGVAAAAIDNSYFLFQ